MDKLLLELYNGNYDITSMQDEAQEEITQKLSVLLEQVQKQIGLDLVDQLTGLYAERSGLSEFRYYQEGFRLGAKLMLAALTPV